MRISQPANPALAPVVLALLLASASPAQESVESARSPAVVSILGASVSDGFVDPRPRADGERNSTVKLARALRPVWEDGAVRFRDRSDLLTFRDPVGVQGRLVERALADGPELVLAIDFMFWFGYGYVGGDEPQARLALQRKGLALLDRFEVPILVGDYPDMTGADRGMLSPRQIPSPEALEALNQGLRDWAAERDRVKVFPLAAFVTTAKTDGVRVRFEGADVQLPPTVILQGDRLHASRVGMTVLVQRIVTALGDLPLAETTPRPLDVDLGVLLDAVDARFVVEEVVEAATEAAAAEAAGGKR